MEFTIKCDNCHHEFEFTEELIKTEVLFGSYKRKYLQCPKCSANYTISYTNEKIEKLQQQWQQEGSVHKTSTHIALKKELRKVNNYMNYKYK